MAPKSGALLRPSSAKPPSDRDLATDLRAIRVCGAASLVTLVEAHELCMLGVPDLGAQARRLGLDWRHLPIADLHPGGDFEAAWPATAAALLATLRGGAGVVVHYRGGLGRAGTVAACLLIEAGATPAEAIRRVRRARPGTQTPVQERYVMGHGRRIAATGGRDGLV